MREKVLSTIGRTFDHRVNCFCVSEFFYRDTQFRQSTADEMLNFVSENFRQVEEAGPRILTLVWSRSSFDIPVGKIQVHELAKRQLGFPFGLVLEHSFVQINENTVFQKADPSLTSKIELVPLQKALEPYVKLSGYELTRHILISQF